MDTLLSMRIFCTVAELCSFSAAANKFNIAHSAVSKHVATLEQRLSARLLNRTSRHVSLTEAGSIYLQQARHVLELVDEMEAQARNTAVKPSGNLKISAPPWFANTHFVSLIGDYRAAYPDVNLEIDFDVIERGASSEYEDLDIALRVTNTPDEGLVAKHLTTFTFRLVATPAFLDHQSRPNEPSDVDGWPLLHYSAYNNNGSVVFHSGERVTFKPVMRSSSTSLLYIAVLAGVGPAFMPSALIENDVAEGRLEFVLPEETASPMKLYALHPHRPYISAKVKTFLKFLETAYK